MNALRLVAIAALLMGSQAYAATGDTTAPRSTGISPAPVMKPSAPAMVGSTKPVVTVTPTKITGITVSSTKLTLGSVLTVKQNGIGDAKNPACGSSISLKRISGGDSFLSGVAQTMEDFSKWPKTQAFVLSQPGQYQVKLGVYQGAPASCGYQGPGSVPGDLAMVEVTDGIAK